VTLKQFKFGLKDYPVSSNTHKAKNLPRPHLLKMCNFDKVIYFSYLP